MRTKLKRSSVVPQSVESNDKTKESFQSEMQSVIKKSMKRKSVDNNIGDVAGVAVSTVTKVGNKKGKKKKKNTGLDGETKNTDTDRSGGIEENPPPAKKVKKTNQSWKSNQAQSGPEVKCNTQRHISYLKEWKNNRSQWKFQTVAQSWLISNMLNESAVSDDLFPVFLEYISEGKGAPLKRAYEEASKVIVQAEIEEQNNPKLERARQIVQAINLD